MSRRARTTSVRIAACVLGAAVAWGHAQAQEVSTSGVDTPVRLSTVIVKDTPTGLAITLRATGPLKVQGVVAIAEPPPRVFLDLPGVRSGTTAVTEVGRGPLRRVRVALNSISPLVTRVVLDLSAPVTYSLRPSERDATELTVVIEPGTSMRPAPPEPASTRRSLTLEPTDSDSLPSRGLDADPSPPASAPPAASPSSPPTSAATPASTAPSFAPMTARAGVASTGRGPSLSPSVSLTTAPLSIGSSPASSPLAQAARKARSTAARHVAERSSPGDVTQPAPSPVLPQASMGAPMPSAPRAWGRATFYSNFSSVSVPDRPAFSSAELLSTFTYHLTDRSTDGVEYGIDLRHSRFTNAGREPRLSIYDGYVGARLFDGQVRLRAGHMWLNDLGGLGAVAGGLAEARQSPNSTSVLGRWRAGLFGGLEPQLYDVGYESGVRKLGGYVAFDGAGARRHVVGYVRVRNHSLVERNALVFTNFLPIGRQVFVYQAAEYDASRPVGAAQGGWTYFFTNARVNPHPRFEVQLTASRGRSLDVRGLSEDILAGRPVAQRAIDGLLYQSLGGRATVEILRGARVYVGYSRDRNNRDDEATGRWLVGAYLSNVARSGIDVAFSDSLFLRPQGSSYHSRYLSVGRMIGRALYLSGDYTTSLSIVRFVRSDGLVVEMRPETSRVGTSVVVTINRTLSLLGSAEYTLDGDVRDLRVISGINLRFQE